MTAPAYVPVEPREHSPECRRGIDPASDRYSLDPTRCERCAALDERLREAALRRRARVKA